MSLCNERSCNGFLSVMFVYLPYAISMLHLMFVVGSVYCMGQIGI